ncbi:MAG: hypothetical protein GY810_16530, partial [Aureispira sp.]|nr:hypothetical protein [Aureispira sp.]
MKITKNEPNPPNHTTDLPFEEVYNFFRVKKDKKTDNVTGLYFKKVQYIEALKNMGFVRYILDGKIYYIKVNDNVAEMIEEHQVLDDFEDLIKTCPKDEIMQEHGIGSDFLHECFVNQLDSLTKPKLLTRLRPEGKLNFQEDTKDKSFFYYQNGFVEVTKKGLEFKTYDKLKGIVFKTQILQRDYIPKPKGKNKNWFKFLSNISAGADRFDSLMSIIGYLLHHYYKTKRKAIIFTDARISEEADGRSGKGLLFDAIKHMMNPTEYDKEAVDISGKDFNKMDRFKYEECALNTKLIHIDDAQRGLNIEQHFVDIARGIKLQRRNKDSVTIPVK